MSKTTNKLVICIDNTGYQAALERRKIYECLPDPEAAKRKMLRVIDESGEATSIPKRCSYRPVCRRPFGGQC